MEHGHTRPSQSVSAAFTALSVEGRFQQRLCGQQVLKCLPSDRLRTKVANCCPGPQTQESCLWLQLCSEAGTNRFTSLSKEIKLLGQSGLSVLFWLKTLGSLGRAIRTQVLMAETTQENLPVEMSPEEATPSRKCIKC